MYDKNQIEDSLEFVRQIKDFYENDDFLAEIDPLEETGNDELFANLAGNLEQNMRPPEPVGQASGAGFSSAEQQKLEEERRLLERERKLFEEERRRQAEEEEKRRQETARLQIEEERRRLAEAQKLAAEKRAAEEERKRLAEEQRIAAEKRAAEEERRRLAEQQRLAAEKRAVEEERRRLAEEQRIAAEKRAAEEERRRLAAEQEEKRRQEAIKKQLEEERRRLAEEKRLAAEKLAAEEERRRQAEKQAELEEKRRQEAIQRQLEEERRRLAEEQRRQAEERRRIEEERQRLVEERLQREIEEQKRREAEKRAAEEAEKKRREAEEKKRRQELVLAEERRRQELEQEERRKAAQQKEAAMAKSQEAEQQKNSEQNLSAQNSSAEQKPQETVAAAPVINLPNNSAVSTGNAAVPVVNPSVPAGSPVASTGDTEVNRLQKRAAELQRQAEMATLEARMRQLQLESQAAQGVLPSPQIHLQNAGKEAVPFAQISIPGMDTAAGENGKKKMSKEEIDNIFMKELEKIQEDDDSLSHHKANGHPLQKYINNFDGKTFSSLIPAEKILDAGYKVKGVVDDQLWNLKHFIQKKIDYSGGFEAQQKTKKLISNIVVIAICVLCAYLIATAITHFVAHPTKVEGESMETTLTNGDTVVIQKMSYYFGHPKRYDVVVFPVPNYNSKTFYIKRVIGLPGEKVQIQEGKVYINDEELASDKYGKDDYIQDPGDAAEPIILAKDEYFVLGDNRNMSTDSRSSYVGLVHEKYIEGKAWKRIWPLSKFSSIGK